ncbi:MAG: HAD family hydrolase [Alphaproteobacteria bacterium]|nr:HAD family hydrolase [Alphaproteobacteria bacterium]
MADWAIIFDVDGVLLELTRAEEDIFFDSFEKHGDPQTLYRDWNSYRIRNDEDIMAEIAARWNIAPEHLQRIKEKYFSCLGNALSNEHITTPIIAGADTLLKRCADIATLGIATANFRQAAKLRLEHAGLWQPVSAHAFGADGGGHKHEILARALASLPVPRTNIIYVGDNLNDVEAGLKNQLHFIGFSTSQERLKQLEAHGAEHVSNNHAKTWELISLLRKS